MRCGVASESPDILTHCGSSSAHCSTIYALAAVLALCQSSAFVNRQLIRPPRTQSYTPLLFWDFEPTGYPGSLVALLADLNVSPNDGWVIAWPTSFVLNAKSRRWASIPRPAGYKSAALPAELRRQNGRWEITPPTLRSDRSYCT